MSWIEEQLEERALVRTCKKDENGVIYQLLKRFPGYCAGDNGTVWSCRTHGGKYSETWHKLSQFIGAGGYYYVTIHHDNRQSKLKVSALITEAFHGERLKGMFCCHNNGIKTDDRASNVRWDTPSANSQQREEHGTSGRAGQKAKYSPEQVKNIRTSGLTCRQLADKYHTSPSVMSRIRNYKPPYES